MGFYVISAIIMVISTLISKVLESKFSKYSQVRLSSGLTGADVARKMLADHGITNVQVGHISGQLTDHYNPETHIVNLSDGVYASNSIAAAAVAAHECGHAVQHAKGYSPLRMRSRLVPAVNFANKLVSIALVVGAAAVGAIGPVAFYPAIVLFGITTLFSLITLPVEINASQRAIAWLQKTGIASNATLPQAKDALKWAAFTYVASALGSVLTLLYLLAATRRR